MPWNIKCQSESHTSCSERCTNKALIAECVSRQWKRQLRPFTEKTSTSRKQVYTCVCVCGSMCACTHVCACVSTTRNTSFNTHWKTEPFLYKNSHFVPSLKDWSRHFNRTINVTRGGRPTMCGARGHARWPPTPGWLPRIRGQTQLMCITVG